MPKLKLLIAGFTIELIFSDVEFEMRRTFLINLIRHRYTHFLVESLHKKADYTITFILTESTKSLLDKERTHFFINLYSVTGKTSLTTFYHISLYQFDLLLTFVLQTLLCTHNGFFIHSSAVLISEKAYLFLGKSGMGKSTAAQLLKDHYPTIADDGIILRKEEEKWFVYQTPFLEKNMTLLKKPEKFLLGKLFFLHKDTEFKVKPLLEKEMISDLLFRQLYSQDTDVKAQYKNMIAFINSSSDIFFALHFRKESTGLKHLMEEVE